MLAEGQAAPAFELRLAHGGVKSLADLSAAAPVLLAFFKVSCPTCQLTAPYIERYFRENGLGVAGVSQDAAEPTRAFGKRFGLTFPLLLDDPRLYAASNAYGLTHVPSLFLVEPGGRIAWASHGFSRADLERLGAMRGFSAFREGDAAPEWKAG